MRIFFLTCSIFYSAFLWAANEHPEERLLDAIYDIQLQKISSAEVKLKKLVAEVPDFKLANFVYADVLSSKITGISNLGEDLNDSLEKTLLLTEIKNRYQAVSAKKTSHDIPSVLARIDTHYRHAIVVDLKQSRLYVFENSQKIPVLINDYFISMGRGGAGKWLEGDLKTPLGVYFIQSYLSPAQLDDKYGSGAYPINYPNAWDRLKGKTGHGIWLHGTRSGTYNRPPLASEGCVVLPNDDLLAVGSYVDLKNTPVLIGENISWLTVESWKLHQEAINEIQNSWKTAWESLNVEDYLNHYSSMFTSGKKDFAYWSNYKRRIAKHKTFVNVKLSNVSLLMHPNENVMVATFLQDYSSDNFQSKSWKRQYWVQEEDGQWRIVFEGEISAPISPRLAANTGSLKSNIND